MRMLKRVLAAIAALILLISGVLFFSAWKIAEVMSQPVEWCTVESIDEEGNVTFTDDPGIVEQKDYTVWDVLGLFYKHIKSSNSIDELFGPVLLETTTMQD